MAVIIGWDPERAAHWLTLFRSAAAAIEAEGRGITPWPAPGDSNLTTGTRVHLMLQGAERGIVGYGTVRTAPFLSFTGPTQGPLSPHVMISWRALLPQDECIGAPELLARVPGIAWDRIYQSELVLPEEAASRLERVWLAPHPSARPGAARRAASHRIDDRIGSQYQLDQGRWSRSAAAL